MFTGIVEAKGTVAAVGDGHISVTSPVLAKCTVGASVAVNGVCLTVVSVDGETARFDVVPETLSRTNLGSLEPAGEVNLELAMPASGRFDGHVVQGHVDGVGRVIAVDTGEDGVMVRISAPPRLAPQIAEKGSITIDGVSLTVVEVEGDDFTVALIPHTLAMTTLGDIGEGDLVNLETDVFAKYTQRLHEAGR
jgi:riboflavin synthase